MHVEHFGTNAKTTWCHWTQYKNNLMGLIWPSQTEYWDMMLGKEVDIMLK